MSDEYYYKFVTIKLPTLNSPRDEVAMKMCRSCGIKFIGIRKHPVSKCDVYTIESVHGS